MAAAIGGVLLGLAPLSAAASEGPVPEVVVVGDSITADQVDVIRSEVTEAGYDSVAYAALGARRIEVSYEWHGWRNSGVDEITALKQEGVDPDLWVVELGTNDLPWIAADPADPIDSATDLIGTVLETIGPDARVAWVTVLNRDDDESSRSFNAALRRAAASDPRLDLLDWYSVARERPDWFRDAVHPNEAGARALADLYAARLDVKLAADLWQASLDASLAAFELRISDAVVAEPVPAGDQVGDRGPTHFRPTPCAFLSCG